MALDKQALAARKAAIKETHRCPWCDAELTCVDVHDSPFNDWDTNEVHVCVNDECEYYVHSRETLEKQGIGGTYRFIWVAERDWCGAVADDIASSVRTPRG